MVLYTATGMKLYCVGLRMVQILHISDAHGHVETMGLLHALAMARTDVEVIAYTGDSYSYNVPQLPAGWAAWPQPTKLAVPGEHDNPDTFGRLTTTWKSEPPWHVMVADLMIIGIDTRQGWNRLRGELEIFPTAGAKILVLLFHHWPRGEDARRIGQMITSHAPTVPVAVLHGHKHPKHNEEPEWEENASLGIVNCARSKVISSARNMRGVAGLITWRDASFSWTTTQADSAQGPIRRVDPQ